jgi:UDP-N-acetylmuramoyl-L-alanyl-D-glutamate--2,6-diaminopimelate ligase
MKLSELAACIPGARVVGPGDVAIARAAHDSRRVRPGDLFVAMPGTRVDGHTFVPKAVEGGAAAVIVEHTVDLARPVPLVVVRDAREAFGLAAHALAGHPTRRLKVCGVTGTSGKTTTTYLVRSIFEKAGWPTGVLGTIAYLVGEREVASTMTTPDADELAGYFAEMVAAGLRAAVFEVSSHALHQRRAAGIHFDVAAFTNLSPEHRDYHPTMEDYRDAKGLLFQGLDPSAAAVLNAADPVSDFYKKDTPARVLTFGLKCKADVTAEDIQVSLSGTRFTLVTPRGRQPARTPLLGRHNVMNCLTAAAVGEALALPPEAVVEGLAAVGTVRGRLEAVPSDRPFTVLVDYAHKTDALEHALGTVRQLLRGGGRLIAVFGCGGNRDREKRPAMAAVAERLADRVVVTNDNPRNEVPEEIAKEICAGFSSMDKVTVELDRRAAIAMAVGEARPGDVVVIAGKGHETYQILGDVTRPFDDREVAAEILRDLASHDLAKHPG